jgi:hypothetical protein
LFDKIGGLIAKLAEGSSSYLLVAVKRITYSSCDLYAGERGDRTERGRHF